MRWNTGIDSSSGDYVAFLDSDDEWMPSHIDKSLSHIRREGLDAVFSHFYIDWGLYSEQCSCRGLGKDDSVVDYLFSRKGGDIRSSTLVVSAKASRAIRFDNELYKHQDWDFALRLSQVFDLGSTNEFTTVLHVNSSGRMSTSSNYEASRRFLSRHDCAMSCDLAASVYARMAISLIESGILSQNLEYFIGKAKDRFDCASIIDKFIIIMISPSLNRKLLVPLLRYSRPAVRRLRKWKRSIS